MDVTLLVNPASGGGDHTPSALERALRDAGHQVRLGPAKGAGLDRALEEAAEVVAVAGGDGTVGRVARRIAERGRDLPLAILPLGTANNIATAYGIAGEPATLAHRWHSASQRRLDVGHATGPWGTKRFVESVGLGVLSRLMLHPDAESMEDTREARERAAQLARDMRPLHWRLELDGEDISGEYLLVEAMNIRLAGPNLLFAHDADAGDGQLDVVLVGPAERDALVAHALDVASEPPRFPRRAGRHLRLWCEAREVHVDDRHVRKLPGAAGVVAVEAELRGETVAILV